MMINYLEEKIKRLTDVELKECYNDILEYNKEGLMGDTFVRRIRNEMALLPQYGDNWDRACVICVIPSILLEIANRHYNN